MDCSRKVKLVPDHDLATLDYHSFDVIVVPGGAGGATLMRNSALVGKVLKEFESAGKVIAAICACLCLSTNPLLPLLLLILQQQQQRWYLQQQLRC